MMTKIEKLNIYSLLLGALLLSFGLIGLQQYLETGADYPFDIHLIDLLWRSLWALIIPSVAIYFYLKSKFNKLEDYQERYIALEQYRLINKCFLNTCSFIIEYQDNAHESSKNQAALAKLKMKESFKNSEYSIEKALLENAIYRIDFCEKQGEEFIPYILNGFTEWYLKTYKLNE